MQRQAKTKRPACCKIEKKEINAQLAKLKRQFSYFFTFWPKIEFVVR